MITVEIRDLRQSVTGNDESLGKSDSNPKNESVTCGKKCMIHARKGEVVSKKKDTTHERKSKVVMDTYEKQDVSYADMVRKRPEGSMSGHEENEWDKDRDMSGHEGNEENKV